MIHSNRTHANLARKHMIAGRISREEYVDCLRLNKIVTKTQIWSNTYDVLQEDLYPNRAHQIKIDALLGLRK